MIRLNVFIQVEKQHYDQVVNIAKELVTASQKDNGCVAYDLFQSTTRQDVLMICETWKDTASLATHEQVCTFHYPSSKDSGTSRYETGKI